MNIRKKVEAMTLEEKIGQKIMLDFRYWDPVGNQRLDMTAPDDVIGRIIESNHVGGVILFSNNLKEQSQIKTLADWYAGMETSGGVRLLIATDNEGGNVFRLPRNAYASFSGNMALAAAIQGGASEQLAYEQGRLLAQDLLGLKINTNFAPVVDVNTNPFNPVINVRAFSDDASLVSRLAGRISAGMEHQGLITTYKHFPGHGSTSTDSHTGLPRVDLSLEQAVAIDLAPYQQAIAANAAPDMVMTAHIQYPALDQSLVTNRNGQRIVVPATMSRQIQTHILREELGYAGVSISDALDMGAITDNFTQEDSVEKVFAAGVDIALMPVSISTPSQADLLPRLVSVVAQSVREGRIRQDDIDASVERILALKARHGLLGNNLLARHQRTSSGASSLAPQQVQKAIADQSITVVINRQSLLPLKDKALRYFILTPQAQQATGIATAMGQQGYRSVVAADESTLTDAQIKENIAKCDVFLLGTLPTNFTAAERDVVPALQTTVVPDDNRYLDWLRYAAGLGKKRVHLALRAPYDIVNYSENTDAAVATYSYFGYNNGVWLGPSMLSLAEVLTGKVAPRGKLPVNLWSNYDAEKNTGTVAYPRGFGLSW
ncbi:glycoside hydrolase family 3 protein [Xanthomonas campestris pv. badrii]|uniref:beta-N-acetylhexosaminidase n=2 Tax=Xanthomonas campestris TaxID=339 RepID=A0A7Z2VEI4_XANCA|nr:glycoside hydrolase family 3 protein [Xanthomonas campestris pv. badrii]